MVEATPRCGYFMMNGPRAQQSNKRHRVPFLLGGEWKLKSWL